LLHDVAVHIGIVIYVTYIPRSVGMAAFYIYFILAMWNIHFFS
jgi:hypothetical protein